MRLHYLGNSYIISLGLTTGRCCRGRVNGHFIPMAKAHGSRSKPTPARENRVDDPLDPRFGLGLNGEQTPEKRRTFPPSTLPSGPALHSRLPLLPNISPSFLVLLARHVAELFNSPDQTFYRPRWRRNSPTL